jgi:hypothetical protein
MGYKFILFIIISSVFYINCISGRIVVEDEIDRKRKEIRWKEDSHGSKTAESAWGDDDEIPPAE